MMALNSKKKGVLPLGSVACLLEKHDDDTYSTCSLEKSPYGFYQTSHLFCYLPLPVESKSSVHINGSFAVSSDRRRLSCETTDDKDSSDSDRDWNEALIADAVCLAYIAFLEHLPDLKIYPYEHYFERWPVKVLEQGLLEQLIAAFYRYISDPKIKSVVFRRGDKSVCLSHCKYLDPHLMETEFAETAFQMCIEHFENEETTIIRLPKT
ncbi:SACS [Mytilus edulis]|uniref:SACS n=1 Tax=Mytilus edulis TaxID=6550 RepID=A0A8S3V9I5_MYTED|nr:SACS [Mytilus edulis]